MHVSEERRARIKAKFLGTLYADCSREYLESPEGINDVEDHVHRRHELCANYVVPWVERHFPLKESTVIELGCGTGTSTAAFAAAAKKLVAYDIHASSLEFARDRLEILGLLNARFILVEPQDMSRVMELDHSCGADVLLFYAALEHMTLSERLEQLRLGWECLRPGGIMVICDTPNRLFPYDSHTSLLPFFNMLPDELALLYFSASPRKTFRDSITEAIGVSQEAALSKLRRLGRGVSYHEFQLAIGAEFSRFILADGYEKEMLAIRAISMEEKTLLRTLRKYGPGVSRAFSRSFLNFILRKPESA